ncbi:NAD-dependent epimerase/dehydratase family protein [Candidatus Daviesbacteria bacterium]|nr:NAD-dependent epimerase/dehydratase family protein [Candidatus Daviesbacteria bacterium]
MNKIRRSLAILGANGLLGKDLTRYLADKFDITPITRENYEHQKEKEFDVFINANGNSRRFWALQNIYKDFEASTVSVYKTLFDFKFKKYIYFSSVDVYANPGRPKNTSEDDMIDVSNLNNYGFHKYLSEQIIKNALDDYIILRPSMIIGKNLKKGPFFDIIKGKPLFMTPDSRLQIITTFAISEIISMLTSRMIKNEIFNIGGEGAVYFVNISEYFEVSIKWSNNAVEQYYEMNVSKLKAQYNLKTSEDYLKDWLSEQKEV